MHCKYELEYIDMTFSTSKSQVNRIDKMYKHACENCVLVDAKFDQVRRYICVYMLCWSTFMS